MTTDTMLKFERRYAAARDKVYAAWTDPKVFPTWFGPQGVHISDFALDVRPGGAWNAIMENDEGQRYYIDGIYKDVVENKRLSFTWAWTNDGVRGHESLVSLDFADDGDGSKLNIVHSGLESDESAENHNMGWTSSLVCLEEVLNA